MEYNSLLSFILFDGLCYVTATIAANKDVQITLTLPCSSLLALAMLRKSSVELTFLKGVFRVHSNNSGETARIGVGHKYTRYQMTRCHHGSKTHVQRSD
jgi:hypothetical protein